MVETVLVNLNGSNVEARRGMTILDLCQEKGISIPTFCYHPQLTPTGACRLCVVEVAGSRTLVASCHTPVVPNIVIQTHSPKVIQTRKMILELLLSTHPDFCLVCDKANVCELRMLAADLGVGIPRFRTKLTEVENQEQSITSNLKTQTPSGMLHYLFTSSES